MQRLIDDLEGAREGIIECAYDSEETGEWQYIRTRRDKVHASGMIAAFQQMENVADRITEDCLRKLLNVTSGPSTGSNNNNSSSSNSSNNSNSSNKSNTPNDNNTPTPSRTPNRTPTPVDARSSEESSPPYDIIGNNTSTTSNNNNNNNNTSSAVERPKDNGPSRKRPYSDISETAEVDNAINNGDADENFDDLPDDNYFLGDNNNSVSNLDGVNNNNNTSDSNLDMAIDDYGSGDLLVSPPPAKKRRNL